MDVKERKMFYRILLYKFMHIFFFRCSFSFHGAVKSVEFETIECECFESEDYDCCRFWNGKIDQITKIFKMKDLMKFKSLILHYIQGGIRLKHAHAADIS